MAASASSRIVWNTGQLVAVLRSPGGPVAQDIWRRGQRVLNQARQNCPVDQGALRASLHAEAGQIDGAPSVKIGSNLEYAIYVHEGTGLYGRGGYITPRSGRFLVWPAKNNSGRGNRRYSGGATSNYVFARRVRGMKGRPFLRDALQAAAG